MKMHRSFEQFSVKPVSSNLRVSRFVYHGCFTSLVLLACSTAVAAQTAFNVASFDRARVLKAANQYLKEKPITITASHSSRSAGGPHDFFSEADYWWPDPAQSGWAIRSARWNV
jgi:hypothetical protein